MCIFTPLLRLIQRHILVDLVLPLRLPTFLSDVSDDDDDDDDDDNADVVHYIFRPTTNTYTVCMLYFGDCVGVYEVPPLNT